jgi:hypothetical protein
MILSAYMLLVLTAFITTIVHAIGKCPLWIPVLLLSVALLVQMGAR